MKLAYGFKENDLPRVIASNKIEISSKIKILVNMYTSLGNLGSFPWSEDFSKEMNKTNTLFFDTT